MPIIIKVISTIFRTIKGFRYENTQEYESDIVEVPQICDFFTIAIIKQAPIKQKVKEIKYNIDA